ncbi:13806_t:CDS:1 [Cetraspora pellucida]|uniref:13806_t:CDS:1 n=1 Tax=Cetraspora pellucida TaxID=1433469 RepID=A0A9N9E183_9GLOM|nr:13806_t:CDS:1 [Cetraspora pellucida]
MVSPSPIITFKKIKLLLFLVIFVIIPLVDSACSCCGEKGHNIRTCDFKNKDCPRKINGKKNKHSNLDISQSNCFFKIKADKFNTKGTKISPSCHCAREGDEQCHGIAKMLGGPGDCENCFSCSRKMNIDMTKMERLVKKSNGGTYIVSCDNYLYANTIIQKFNPKKGSPTSTTILRNTNYHDEI